MNLNEIKKALYKQKPIVQRLGFEKDELPKNLIDVAIYKANIVDSNSNDKIVMFHIPFSEMNNNQFKAQEQAQLLIRWLNE